ncbi:hypothetical protein ACIQU6_15190 [Streptomyces sp. NPDC090442]|uniref:hypothetical protein n=1 Tax=Streptomyces sp. NPDC090442 TaxID=3365962 RepID=UPI00381E1CA0
MSPSRAARKASGSQSAVGDEAGIAATGRERDGHLYVLDDRSGDRGADAWVREVCLLVIEVRADAIAMEPTSAATAAPGSCARHGRNSSAGNARRTC